MSIFGSIMGAIFGKGSAQASASPTAAPSAPPAQTVDVAAIVDKAAAAKGEKLAWRTSIVDLMKALDLDSSLSARKQLAKELQLYPLILTAGSQTIYGRGCKGWSSTIDIHFSTGTLLASFLRFDPTSSS